MPRKLLSHIDRKAFPRILIYYHKHPDTLTVLKTFGHKIIRPYMVVMLWLFPVTAVITSSSIKSLALLSVYFKSFLAPKTVYTLKVNQPAVFPKQYRYPAITVPRMIQ